ncbi:fused DSP-PTPase phosphatase/NAD kinase-like protein [Saccharospirillum mangrovi]|uniref:fused DSP-PTPase phosphatase/NAD kinase-like protein n=1 Tax=Saccharospirillum mangrovi TaxID=2161747 RepID=UPI000D39DD37|nr:tyrosine-protein phosphatase [Saccharospirillum mangrovi]
MANNNSWRKRLKQKWHALCEGDLNNPWYRFVALLDLWLFDFALLRFAVNHPYEVVPGIWRSNQPTPWRLKALAGRGFKSVINLRGPDSGGAYQLERFYCDRLGLAMYDVKMSARRPPDLNKVEQLKSVLAEAPRPLLLHCKSGADRAGLASALVKIYDGQPIAVAKRQLSLRFLHLKGASTGMLDYFLETYEAANRLEPISFDDWLKDGYDRDYILNSFTPKPWSEWLVSRVLKRE